jgi:general secretion pathway protein G
MKRKQQNRKAFTLIELLVVILIIAILMGLVGSAAFKAIIAANRTRNRTEIGQLQAAVEAFKTRYKMYPPSQIILCEVQSHYFVGGIVGGTFKSKMHQDSYAFLTSMFPRLGAPTAAGLWTTTNTPSDGVTAAWTGIDWNGDTFQSGDVTLEGDQCLVFFLGGIPSTSAPYTCLGFSTNPSNPAYHVEGSIVGGVFVPNGGDIIPPFFDFPSNRLAPLAGTAIPAVKPYTSILLWRPARSTTHFSFYDSYGTQPYLYFSSYKVKDGYNHYYDNTTTDTFAVNNKDYFPFSDCYSAVGTGSLGSGNSVWPYLQSASSPFPYWNGSTFQIISAGADGQFGCGSDPTGTATATVLAWSPSNANIFYVNGSVGADDQSNFSNAPLGINQ